MNDFVKGLDTPIYKLKVECKQLDAAGGNLQFQVITGNGTRLEVFHAAIYASAITANRTGRIVWTYDQTNLFSYIGWLVKPVTFGSLNIISYPVSENSPIQGSISQPITVCDGEVIQFNTQSLAQNERVQIELHAYIRGRIPSRDVDTHSTGSIEDTVIYEKII